MTQLLTGDEARRYLDWLDEKVALMGEPERSERAASLAKVRASLERDGELVIGGLRRP